tara:strand:+ start:983 stop:2155 length:1173 start_codon:yes stop_codon:yes gene_type:complete
MERKYQIILYGASGFTGKLCAEYLQKNYNDLDWAIAGRNKNKLENLKNSLNLDCDIFIAAGDDKESIDNFVSKTKVVLSTAGPFARYSNLIVKSCVENKTHYTDITGENHWVKDLIDQYHLKASEEGTKIVPSCGYDSIPSDMGVFYSVQEMGKPVKKVTVYHSGQGGVSGGTTETMFSIGPLSKEKRDPFLLNPENSVSEKQRKLSKDGFEIKQIENTDSYSGIGIMSFANTRVVRRSSALYDADQISYGSDFIFKELGSYPSKRSARLASFGLIFAFLVISTPLRHIVRRFLPKPGEGPDKETRENGWFKGLFKVEAEDGETKYFQIYGEGDPGYKATAQMVCESAITLAVSEELDSGGVLTSAYGLGNPLLERLINSGIKFEEVNYN